MKIVLLYTVGVVAVAAVITAVHLFFTYPRKFSCIIPVSPRKDMNTRLPVAIRFFFRHPL